MPRVVRVMVHFYAPIGHSPAHVYLGEAKKLRADLEAVLRRRSVTIGDMTVTFAEKLTRSPAMRPGCRRGRPLGDDRCR